MCVCVSHVLNLFPLIFLNIKLATKCFLLRSYRIFMTSFLTAVAVFLSSSLHSKEPPATVDILEVSRESRQYIKRIFSI